MLDYKRVFLGGACNNNCSYCPQDSREPRPLPEVAAAIETAGDDVLLFGGEPTQADDLLYLVKVARGAGVLRLKLATNGRALASPGLVESLLEAGVAHFQVRLWAGEEELHDSLTRIPGSFRETWQGLENLRAQEAELYLEVLIQVCRQNYRLLEGVGQSLLPLEPDRLLFSLCDPGLSPARSALALRGAIETAIFGKVWALTQGWPLCMMTGFEAHVSEIYERPAFEGKKPKSCKACLYNPGCPGLPQAYFKAWSKELKPVRSARYRDEIMALKERRDAARERCASLR